MSFIDIDIKREYRSLHRDVVTDFYTPLLNESKMYRRAVGFFSSTALICLAEGIKKLVERGGKIEVIASPRLSEEDFEAIRDGFNRRHEIIENCLIRSLVEPKGKFEKARLNLLSNLIAAGVMTMKIAILESHNEVGLFHEKFGLMYDFDGNVVAFAGSMNESANAYHLNYESVDVFKSWTSDKERVRDKQVAFDAMWGDYEPGITVLDFPNVEKEIVKRYRTSEQLDFRDIDSPPRYLEFDGHDRRERRKSCPRIPDEVVLRPYQKEAIDSWKQQGFRGIFDMATGTGKTFTALAAICALSDYTNHRLAVVIVCPFQHLVEQWKEDIVRFGMKPIVCHSASKQRNWKDRVTSQIDGFNMGIVDNLCIVTTNASFATDFMQLQIGRLTGNCLIVVDEAHNFGAPKLLKTLPSRFLYRLALSATIERFSDEYGTSKLFDYFGAKCIEYTLDEAIKNRMLTQYYYYPVPITLNADELEEYLDLSKQIGRAIATAGAASYDDELSDHAKMLLIKRARLVAAAHNKLGALVKAITPYKDQKHILVYCGATTVNDAGYRESSPSQDDCRQIDIVVQLLNSLNMKAAKFTSEENAEKREILKESFSEGRHHQALVAIRCLDEGVNIPNIRTAFILASSVNPKEYIQRRGRVLRKAPGKEYAEIFDFIALPVALEDVTTLDEETMRLSKSLVVKEVARMRDFSKLALNPFDTDSLIWDICNAFEITEEDERNMNYE